MVKEEKGKWEKGKKKKIVKGKKVKRQKKRRIRRSNEINKYDDTDGFSGSHSSPEGSWGEPGWDGKMNYFMEIICEIR